MSMVPPMVASFERPLGVLWAGKVRGKRECNKRVARGVKSNGMISRLRILQVSPIIGINHWLRLTIAGEWESVFNNCRKFCIYRPEVLYLHAKLGTVEGL